MVQWLHAVPAADKLGHFVLLGTMSLLVNLSMDLKRWRIGGRELLAGSIIVAILATAEEFTQRFIPTRSFSLLDLAANYLGIFVFGRLAESLARGTRATNPPT